MKKLVYIPFLLLSLNCSDISNNDIEENKTTSRVYELNSSNNSNAQTSKSNNEIKDSTTFSNVHHDSLNSEAKTSDKQKSTQLIKDSISIKLIAKTKKFISLLESKELIKIQEMMHPNGIYFFSLGKIKPINFNTKKLNKIKGLDPFNNYFEDSDSTTYISAMDYINLSYFEMHSYTVQNEYFNPAFGSTGHYSSPHMCEKCGTEMDLLYGDKAYRSDKMKIVSAMYKSSKDSSTENYLVVEFFKHEGVFKIFAVGSLVWTP